MPNAVAVNNSRKLAMAIKRNTGRVNRDPTRTTAATAAAVTKPAAQPGKPATKLSDDAWSAMSDDGLLALDSFDTVDARLSSSVLASSGSKASMGMTAMS